MESKKYIGLDVHQASISAAVRDDAGKLVIQVRSTSSECRAPVKQARSCYSCLRQGGPVRLAPQKFDFFHELDHVN